MWTGGNPPGRSSMGDGIDTVESGQCDRQAYRESEEGEERLGLISITSCLLWYKRNRCIRGKSMAFISGHDNVSYSLSIVTPSELHSLGKNLNAERDIYMYIYNSLVLRKYT